MSRETKEEILTAVVVVESFNPQLETIGTPWATTPIHGRSTTLLAATLESLVQTPVVRVLLCTSTDAQRDVWDEYVRNWSLLFGKGVEVVPCSGAESTGDIIRHLDRHSILNADFVLCHAGCLFTDDLTEAWSAYKQRRRKDKNAVLTLMLGDIGMFESDADAAHKSVMWTSFARKTAAYIGMCKETNKMLYYRPSHGEIPNDQITLPKAMTKHVDTTVLRRHLLDARVCIMSAQAATQFSDNFDFRHTEDLVAEILVNEEVLGQSVHIHMAAKNSFVGCVDNVQSLLAVQRLMSRRWTYPIVPDCMSITYPSPTLSRTTHISPTALVDTACAIGVNVHVGDGAVVENCVLGDGVRVGAGAILRQVFIGEKTIIGQKCNVGPYVTIAKNMNIPDNTTIERRSVLVSSETDPDDDYVTKEICKNVYSWTDSSCALTPLSASRASLAKMVNGATAKPPITSDDQFTSEVIETLQRGYDDKLSSKNLSLEINGSRFAYNVAPDELVEGLVNACLAVAHHNTLVDDAAPTLVAATKEVFTMFKGVILNYVKTHDAQMNMLESLETAWARDKQQRGICSVVLHSLFEEDVVSEASIIEWFTVINRDDDLDSEDGEDAVDGMVIGTSEDDGRKEIVEKMLPFITWLQEAEEESSDDE